MLQYFISAFFVAVGVIAIFTIVDSCIKASREFRSLMREREVLDQIWDEAEIGFPPQSLYPNVLRPIWSKSAVLFRRSNQKRKTRA